MSLDDVEGGANRAPGLFFQLNSDLLMYRQITTNVISRHFLPFQNGTLNPNFMATVIMSLDVFFMFLM